ncbi:unnamed protein product [Alternaria sp. RS040]
MNTGSFRKNAEISHINSSLDLLRPYMAFQLSVSGLSGKAYEAAQVSMASVLDVVESLEKQGSIAPMKKRNSLRSSAEDGEVCTDRENRAGGEEEEDVLLRKQRDLNEQTWKRLEQNKRRKEKRGKDNRHAIIRPSSSSSASFDAATEVASDTEDEAKYPPTKSFSVLSTTSSYQSLHRSTDSAETSSRGSKGEMYEKEKNVTRRVKRIQKWMSQGERSQKREHLCWRAKNVARK